MAAFCFLPVFRASLHRWSTVARAMPRLSATMATDRASEGSAGRLKSTIGTRASFAARIMGMMLFASFGTTMIPSTPRAMKPRTCSSWRLASPSAIASSIPSCDFAELRPDGVDARHPELGLQRLEGDAHRPRSAVALARVGAREPDAHCHQKSRRRPRPHRHRDLQGLLVIPRSFVRAVRRGIRNLSSAAASGSTRAARGPPPARRPSSSRAGRAWPAPRAAS